MKCMLVFININNDVFDCQAVFVYPVRIMLPYRGCVMIRGLDTIRGHSLRSPLFYLIVLWINRARYGV